MTEGARSHNDRDDPLPACHRCRTRAVMRRRRGTGRRLPRLFTGVSRGTRVAASPRAGLDVGCAFSKAPRAGCRMGTVAATSGARLPRRCGRSASANRHTRHSAGERAERRPVETRASNGLAGHPVDRARPAAFPTPYRHHDLRRGRLLGQRRLSSGPGGRPSARAARPVHDARQSAELPLRARQRTG
jgi:hypothetical protein